jgi:hypothetical protein
VDQSSGKSGDRDAFRRLFEDASRRMFDRVVVWVLDHFTREGVLETFEHVRCLTACGVAFDSYAEQHFRTTVPAGELMLAIAAWIANQERIRISDRTKAGLERAGIPSAAATARRDIRSMSRSPTTSSRRNTRLGLPEILPCRRRNDCRGCLSACGNGLRRRHRLRQQRQHFIGANDVYGTGRLPYTGKVRM